MLRATQVIRSTRPFSPSRRVARGVVRLAQARRIRRVEILAAKTVLEPSHLEPGFAEDTAEEKPQFEYDPLTTTQVKSLITTLCEGTRIAQLNLRLGSYKIKIQRSVGNSVTDVTAAALTDPRTLPPQNGGPPARSIEDSFAEEEAMASIDESLMLIDSPKVGFFRLGVYNKNGKKVGKGPVPGDQVKAGQNLCAIEQLGTFTPILAPQPGEVLAFPFHDGEPVAYQDAVVEFAPYFGGHIIGDKKYA